MNKKSKQEKQKLAKQVTEKIVEMDEKEKIEELLSNNKIEFNFGKNAYKVHKPNLKDREEIRKARNKKYIELLDDDNYYLKRQLIQKLKNKGIDIKKLERQQIELASEIEKLQEKITPIDDEKIKNQLKEEIISIMTKQEEIALDIRDYLSPCLEIELSDFSNLYTIYYTLEIKNGDKWEKAFKNYQDFENSTEDGLIQKAVYYLSLLIFPSNLSKNEE